MRNREHGYEDEKQFIATTYIDLTRHGSRFGGPMEIRFSDGTAQKIDDGTDLSPEGRKGAKEYGANAYPPEVTLVHPRGGDEARHGQTGEDILQGSGKFGRRPEAAPVIGKDKKVKGARRGRGVDYAGAGMSEALKDVKQLINTELNSLVAKLSSEEEKEFKTGGEFCGASPAASGRRWDWRLSWARRIIFCASPGWMRHSRALYRASRSCRNP